VSHFRDVVPRAIDEFPAICVAAARAEGVTTIRDAREPAGKRNRPNNCHCRQPQDIGHQSTGREDGMDITGSDQLLGGSVDSRGDHRIAMSMSVAALVAATEISVVDIGCVATSFPTFFPLLEKVASR